MWKLAVSGAALLVAGGIKFAAHLSRPPLLVDYLAFRCAPSQQADLIGPVAPSLLNLAHCWGCYAMVAGAGIMFLALSRRLRVSWPAR